MVQEAGLQERISIDSCGTSAWHIGNPPDPRSIAMAAARGVDLSNLKASQIQPEDFRSYDYILAMDNQNLADLQQVAPVNSTARVELLLALDEDSVVREVPDPYYGGEEGFTLAVELIESASAKLLSHIRTTL